MRAWTDQFTGMIHLSGQFDPESGLKLLGRVAQQGRGAVPRQGPGHLPGRSGDKQDHLRALALTSILDGTGTGTGDRTTPTGGGDGTAAGSGSGAGRPDLIVVIDEQTLRSGLH